ncbi:MAG: NAD(P)/FAD-dependent oxidoreductase [Acidobacteria bacterium]|nr:NAD(P)/FAD-dependent oxidoreductase [Acidobacteriota bacterium]
MPANSYDAIVIGGGHNGLVTAAYLAKAGRRVLVLERRHVLGGAAVTEEVYPGFRFSVCSYVVSLLRPEILRELELARHGLELLPLDCTLNPLLDGDYLIRWSDAEQTRREIARHSAADSEAYPEFGRVMTQMARFVRPVLDEEPPDPASIRPSRLRSLLNLGRRFRALPDELRHQQVKLMTTSAVDFLRQWFESDVLVAALSASGIIGTFLGVRSPGTAYVLLHHYMGEIDGSFRSWGIARGGNGAVSEAIAAAAMEHGAEIRREAPVARIDVRRGAAVGVTLENGEEIRARVVASGVDPKRTFLGLVEPEHLDREFRERVGRYRFRGSSGKVNLALDRLPTFRCLPGSGPHLRGAIAIGPSVEYLERAYEEAKYGDFSSRPYLDIVIPTLTDPTMAPPGKHVMSIFVQYAPYHLRQGTWDERREEFGDAVLETLAEHAPDLPNLVLHRQVLTPLDLEREFGLTEGNIFHGELSREQLFFQRPVAGHARYRTPIRNLYLCGSGAHPGGGVMGAPGRLAARSILREVKR